MFSNESVKLTGALRIVRTDDQGVVKETREIPNLVVSAGKNWIASRLKDGGPGQVTHMAVGTGATPAAAGDTALQTEVAGSRTGLATSGGTVASNVVTYQATFGPGVGTGALTEAGLFNAASAGTMVCRTVFGVVTKSANDTITITWSLTVN